MTPDELKTLQAKLGLTTAQLAERIGTSTSTVTKWRIGAHEIPTVAAIAMRSLLAEVQG